MKVGIDKMRTRQALIGGLAAVLLGSAVAGCGSDDGSSSDGRPTVVVTYSVLGSVVREAVGDAAEVVVLMPNGADPHEWAPSAKDIAMLEGADLVVRNGLGLEGGLEDALDTAADDGVTTFVAADHVTVRRVGEGEGLPTDDPDQAVGAEDPHLWMDPLALRDVVTALGPVLDGLGIDTSASVAATVADLTALDGRVRDIVAEVPDDQRLLVTGHESLGWFADRYGFRLIGAIVPSLSSAAEASSADLADLTRTITETGTRAIFTETGTPASIAEAIASDTGVAVVELPTVSLPDDGTYDQFLVANATLIADALATP
jgi:zinc/manganese transport system substrate-binding protein